MVARRAAFFFLFLILGISGILASKALPATSAGCAAWQVVFVDEFDSDSGGWQKSPAGGSIQYGGGAVKLSRNWGQTFPIMWRNDIFGIGAEQVFAFEAKVKHENITAYGTTVALGTDAYNGQRYAQGDLYPILHFENVLQIHHYDQEARVSVLLNTPVSYADPADPDWHVIRIEVYPSGGNYMYYLLSLIHI